jgi:hypothetical protein
MAHYERAGQNRLKSGDACSTIGATLTHGRTRSGASPPAPVDIEAERREVERRFLEKMKADK